jgi:hypothetical protein
MFPSHSPEQATIASELRSELAAYESGLRRLLELRWDPELYRELSERFDRIQLLAEALPRLATTWTELLISRVDLMHALWTMRAPTRINGRVVAFHGRHKGVIQEARRKCALYVSTEACELSRLLAD